MDLQEAQHRLSDILHEVSILFQKLPGSAILLRYIRSSYQNDPVRSAVELFLFLFAVRYLLAPTYSTKRKVKLTDDEIDELVEDWTPEPLVAPQTSFEEAENEKRPVIVGPTGPKSKLSNGRTVTNLASYNFYNLTTNPYLQERAIHILRTYGVGPCSPPGFYGTQDVHIKTEADVASHLGAAACIVYAQAFSTISSVIPAFSKRGDIIVADKAVNYAIRKGIQISRSSVRWYEHNDMEDMERVLKRVVKEQEGRELTRRFIVTEALFENIGDMLDLPKVIELKTRHKFRLILDETSSFAVLGRTARGITEHQNVDPLNVDMIIGSLAGPLCAGGGFCAGSAEIVEHQRISAAAYTFSAALPAMLATTASEVLAMLGSTPTSPSAAAANIVASAVASGSGVSPSSSPNSGGGSSGVGVIGAGGANSSANSSGGGSVGGSAATSGGQEILHALRENTRLLRAQLDPRSDWIRCTSALENPVLIFVLRDDVVRARRGWDVYAEQEHIMQDIVDECLAQGVLITRVKRMPRGASAQGWPAKGVSGAVRANNANKQAAVAARHGESGGTGSGVRSGDDEWEVQPALKVCVTVGLNRKEVERAGTVIRHAVTKVVKARK